MLTDKCSPYNNQMQKAGSQDKLLWPQPSPASDLERWKDDLASLEEA